MTCFSDSKIAVVGLGYVGLPLAVEFGKKNTTVGFDINETIVENAKNHQDPTGEVETSAFKESTLLEVTCDPEKLSSADYIIVAVPTPIDNAQRPDLTLVQKASETVAGNMKKGVTVIYESTVYPGVTEDICAPILEKISGFEWKKDFFIGYSPERINPGDKEHTLTRIVKVVSGDSKETLEKVAGLYESIIEAGVHRTGSIKEAEAAKVIENTQRDLNISLMNELAIIFDKMDIDTSNVLEAAGSKWNFLPFKPGLVGGHCIGVDPYYLTYKAQMLGYNPEVILSGRRINDGMGRFIASKAIKMMINAGHNIKESRVGVLGLTFKEDCPDLRNTRVTDLIEELKTFGVEPLVHDPLADPAEAKKYYGIDLCSWDDLHGLDAFILAVPHKAYKEVSTSKYIDRMSENGCVVDVKSILDMEEMEKTGVSFWRL